MSRNRRLVDAIGFGGFSRLFALGLAVVQVPVVVTHLGKEAYGFWLVCSSLAAWIALSDAGISNGLMNSLARCFANNQREEARSVYSSGMALLLGIALALSLASLAVFYLPAEDIFHLQGEKLRQSARLAAYLAIVIPIWILALEGMTKPYLAYQDVRPINLWNMAGGLLSLVLVIGAARLGGGLPMLMLASAAGLASCRFAAWVQLVASRHPHLMPRLSAVSPIHARQLFRVGSGFLVTGLSWLLLAHTDQLIIGTILGAERNASYGLAMKILGYVLVLPNLLHISLWPAYAEAAESGNLGWIRRSLVKACITSAGLVGLFLAGFCFFGGPLVSLWTGRTISVELDLLMLMVPLGIVFTAVSQLTALLNALEKFRVMIPAVVAAGILNVALSLALVRPFGEAGVMIATTACLSVQIALLLPCILRILNGQESIGPQAATANP